MFSLYTPLQPRVTPTPLLTTFSHPAKPHQQHPYTPQTPSPLRTSRYANLMPPPPPTPRTESSPLSDTSYTSPFDFSSPSFNSTSSDHDQENAMIPANLTFTADISTKTSRFAERARSQSPQAALSQQTATARDRRKSQFLDRIRSKRDESRFADKGDQVLRMDWVRERREWEAERARIAKIEELDGVGDVDDMLDVAETEMDLGRDEEELSPTEEREMEELLTYMPDAQRYHDGSEALGGYVLSQDGERSPDPWTSHHSDLHAEADPVLDDDDYDRLFMEMDMDMASVDTNQPHTSTTTNNPTHPPHTFPAQSTNPETLSQVQEYLQSDTIIDTDMS